ncbi:BREX-1 system adenine-specific DNA-methyltransferase PglX [Inediibacterium massiliense]|uniref:BREX-1 system adenine-specific DNA-methyltransferase PglX n=1 Tax=Inediibacterium massiliense TaxID=1658111 RepID=UPI0006B670FB|nr:BREX-1 system adenine-specific DNA-methyltransferase PglX [Inediibacterium massiliense]
MDHKKMKDFINIFKKELKKEIIKKAFMMPIPEKLWIKGLKKIVENMSYKYFYCFIILEYMRKKDMIRIKNYTNHQEFFTIWDDLCKVVPFVFQPIQEDEKTLFPNSLNNIKKVLDDFFESECMKKVENIGWLYQYYFLEKQKSTTGIHKTRMNEEEMIVATQIFTPEWICKYMVDNTVGKLWVEDAGNENIKKYLSFYISQKEVSDRRKIDPKNIKVIDPACGAGNLLSYAFDVLYLIYIQEGYSPEEIPKYILKYNLYGLDVDEKVVYIARFILFTKAWEKNKNIFYEFIYPSIYSIQESNDVIGKEENFLKYVPKEKIYIMKKEVENLFNTFYDAKKYGSILKIKNINIEILEEYIEWMPQQMKKMIIQWKILSDTYDVVIMNPPYLANKRMHIDLKRYVDEHYKDYKEDLFAAFIKRAMDFAKRDGYIGCMTSFVWMFIKRYEKIRKYILSEKSLKSLIQLEYSSFEDATVPIGTFVMKNCKQDQQIDFIRLCKFKGAKVQPQKVIEAIKNESIFYRYKRKAIDFQSIPGVPLAFWIDDSIINVFQLGVPLKKIAQPRVGLQTSNNKEFVRYWFEVDPNKIGFGYKSRESAKISGYKWFPYQKGGEFRKWYGNHIYVVDWEKDGERIREYNKKLNASRTSNIGIANTSYYFKKGISWSFVNSSRFSARFREEGFLFDTSASSLFCKKNLYFIIAFLCSKVASYLLNGINPTLNVQPGNMGLLPIIFPDEETKEEIQKLSKECIDLSKKDWDQEEMSWNFKIHPFVIYKRENIKNTYLYWEEFCEKNIKILKEKEERLNKIFIKLYGCEKILNDYVEDQEITIRKIDKKQELKKFISYGVGCMMGRYSLKEYERKGFYPCKDGIIPITNGFSHSIVPFFIKFIDILFGKEDREKNIYFLFNGLEKEIKKYFEYEFYKDHMKFFHKRPIYWMLSSGKYKSFEAFLYVHKFNPNTICIIRNNYIQKIMKQKEKMYQQEPNHLEIYHELEELRRYDEKLEKLEGISIDLDEGIQKNYKKFKSILNK